LFWDAGGAGASALGGPIVGFYTSNLEELESNSTIEEEHSDLDLIDSSAKDVIVGKSIDLNNTNLESNNSSRNPNSKEELVLNKNTIELVHARLGHINIKANKELIDNTKGVVLDPKDIDTARVSLDNCSICIQSKLTKSRNIESSTKISSYLDLLHINIGGPVSPKTFGGFKYYITFRDSYTKYLVVILLKSRK
jgi:hypothetical protein